MMPRVGQGRRNGNATLHSTASTLIGWTAPAPVQQQTPQMQPALHPLIRTDQRREHLPSELLQPPATRREFTADDPPVRDAVTLEP